MLPSFVSKVAPNLRDPKDRWKTGVAVVVCLTGVLTGSGVVRPIAAICLAIVAGITGLGAWFTWAAPCTVGEDEDNDEDTGLPWLPPV